jgi:hypothetical protein
VARKPATRAWHLLTGAEAATSPHTATAAAAPGGNAVTGPEEGRQRPGGPEDLPEPAPPRSPNWVSSPAPGCHGHGPRPCGRPDGWM